MLSCPFGITRCDPQKKFPEAHLVSQVSSQSSCCSSLWTSTPPLSINTQKGNKNLAVSMYLDLTRGYCLVFRGSHIATHAFVHNEIMRNDLNLRFFSNNCNEVGVRQVNEYLIYRLGQCV